MSLAVSHVVLNHLLTLSK